MTHETKAGLVVSGSFLCLVAVVLVCKLKEKDPGPTPYAQADGKVEVPAEPTQDPSAASDPFPGPAGSVISLGPVADNRPTPLSPSETPTLLNPPSATTDPQVVRAAATSHDPAPPSAPTGP